MKHLSPRPATPVLPVCRSLGRRGWRCLEQTTANPTRILAPFRPVWKANRDIRQPAAARTWYAPTAASFLDRICSLRKRSRAMSRSISVSVSGGSLTPWSDKLLYAVRSFAQVGSRPLTPKRTRQAFIRLTRRVVSLISVSRSRLRRFASLMPKRRRQTFGVIIPNHATLSWGVDGGRMRRSYCQDARCRAYVPHDISASVSSPSAQDPPIVSEKEETDGSQLLRQRR